MKKIYAMNKFFEVKIKGISDMIVGNLPTIEQIICEKDFTNEIIFGKDIEIIDITHEAVEVGKDIYQLRGATWDREERFGEETSTIRN